MALWRKISDRQVRLWNFLCSAKDFHHRFGFAEDCERIDLNFARKVILEIPNFAAA